MWTRALLKKNGKVAFLRNYWTCVVTSWLAALLCGGIGLGYNYNISEEELKSVLENTSVYDLIAQIPNDIKMMFLTAATIGLIVGLCMNFLVSNVATVGHVRYYLENREHKTGVGQLFYGFQNGRYGKTVSTMFLRNLYILGWSFLLLIPGLVKSYAYSMVPYILAENPSLDRKRVFELSEQMMNGHKWEAFELSLSFTGWILLGSVSGGMINIFYTQPYVTATFVEFYSALKAEARMKGIIQEGELSDRLFLEE